MPKINKINFMFFISEFEEFGNKNLLLLTRNASARMVYVGICAKKLTARGFSRKRKS